MKKIKKLKTSLFQRNLALAKIATKVGKDIYLSKRDELNQKINETILKRADFLKGELGELKGSFLKAGQMLSMYSQDLLPKEFSKLLNELASQTSYLDWEVIRKQIPQKTLDELSIEENAFAAASIGQVHIAFKDQKKLALKIQYKNVEKLIDTDLWILKKLLNIFNIIPKAYSFDEVFEEVKSMLTQEMNYIKELEHTARFKDFAKDEYIIPTVFKDYSDKNTICFEFIEAQSVEDYLKIATIQMKEELAYSFFKIFLYEIFQWKILQSDAHLGNYLIKDDKWVLLDFGATKEINDDLYENLVHALFKRDRELLEKTLTNQGSMDMENTDLDYFWDYCLLISEPLQDIDFNWSETDIVSSVINKAQDLSQKVKFHRLPSENVFIDRKIGGVYFMLKKIGATINLNKFYKDFKNSL